MPKLSATQPLFHPGARATNSTFGPWTEVGEGARIQNSEFLAYAYCDRFADVANTTVGKFANIAAFTRIGPTDHPMDMPACITSFTGPHTTSTTPLMTPPFSPAARPAAPCWGRIPGWATGRSSAPR